jgi:hypothetical protein
VGRRAYELLSDAGGGAPVPVQVSDAAAALWAHPDLDGPMRPATSNPISSRGSASRPNLAGTVTEWRRHWKTGSPTSPPMSSHGRVGLILTTGGEPRSYRRTVWA